jgi:ADP-ribosylglycohydrolase
MRWGGSRPVDGPDRGFCLYAAAAGLQAVARGGPFEEELTRVVSLGGDTGANGAVAGALLGALHGRTALPSPWLDRLADGAAIEEEASALARLAAEGPHHPNGP